MVGRSFHAIDLQRICNLLDFLSAQAIDDSTPPLVLQRMLDDLTEGIFLGAHLVEEVGPIEARLVHIRIDDAEVFLDVMLDLGRGSCRQRYDGEAPDAIDDFAQPPVLRPEIVAPFGNAVGFVNGEEAQPD